MPLKTEAAVLAETFNFVRALTKFYFKQAEGIDPGKRFETGGVKLNSMLWIAAHIVWTEHLLIVQGVGKEKMDIPWLESYSYDSDPDKITGQPGFDEVMKRMDEVHARSMDIITGLKDNELDEQNHIDFSIGGTNNKRNLINHAIRHEPMHVGQLSWLIKMKEPGAF